MKKYLFAFLVILSFLALPVSAFAITDVWTATSTDKGYIAPNTINGNNPYVSADHYVATSTSATSTFAYGLNVTGGCIALSNTCLTSNLGTLTSITATSPLTGGTITSSGPIGIQAASASQNGYLSLSDYSLLHTATTTFTSPLIYTLSTNAVTCQTASGSQAGCLSSTDWTTFNGKQASGNYITALTGDVTASGPGSVAATLATVNGNVGPFGGASSIPSFTVNGKGLITAASANTPSIPVGDITGVLPVANGGTASSTLGGIITGAGTSAVTSATIGSGISFSGNTLSNSGVTSIVAGTNVTISGSTGAVTINSSGGGGTGTGNVGTSSVGVKGNLAYWTTAGATPELLGNTSTSSIGAGTGLTFSGTAGNQVGGTNGTYSVNTTQNITTLSNLSTAGTVNNTSGGALYSTGTSSLSVAPPLTLTGTAGALIGGTNLTINCPTCVTSASANYFTNSGAQTYLNIGGSASHVDAPFFNATSTIATSTFSGNLLVGTASAGLQPVGGVANTSIPTQFQVTNNDPDLITNETLGNLSSSPFALGGLALINSGTPPTGGATATNYAALAFSSPTFAAYPGLLPNSAALNVTDGQIDLAATSANEASSSINFASGPGFTSANYDVSIKDLSHTQFPGNAYQANLGIGSSTPFGRLTISASSTSAVPYILVASTTNCIVGSTCVNSQTIFQLTNTGIASTTNLTISGLGNGSTQCLQINGSGIVTGSGNTCTTGGTNYWTNVGSNTFLNTGTVAQFPSFQATSTATSSATGGFYATEIAAPYLQATSTTATSTLAGDLTVGTGTGVGLVQDYTGNVGIGTTTPSFLFAVQGSSFTAGGATSTNLSATSTLFLPFLTGTQCLQEIGGLVSGTGSACGAGGGSGGGNSKWASSTPSWTGSALTPNGGILTKVVIGETGTSTPTSILEVNGTTTVQNLIASSTTASSTFAADLTDGTGLSALSTDYLGNVAVGSSTQGNYSAVFSVSQNSTSTPIFPFFVIASSTNMTTAQIFTIDQYGHRMTGGIAPTCGSGCSSVTGDDSNMRAITGSGVTAVIVNFASTWVNTRGVNITPVCNASDESGGTTVSDASSTPTTVTMNLSASLTTKMIAIHCEGSNNATF